MADRRPTQVLATLALVAAAFPGASPAVPASGLAPDPPTVNPAPNGPLHADGRWFKDSLGRVVILHGLQVARKTPPYYPPVESFDERDADLIASLGINAVRLAWFWKGLEPTEGTIDTAYLGQIVRAAKILAARGIFLLVEFHQDLYSEPVRGSGFPDWATATGGAPLGPDAGFPGNYLASPALNAAFDNLYRDGALQDAYAAAWKTVAGAFADEPMVLGYDLYNEPWPGSLYPTCASPAGCPLFDRAFLQPLQDRLAAAIREADTRAIVFYEPNLIFDFGAASYLDKPPAVSGPTGLSFHDYCLASAANWRPDHESESPLSPTCPPADGIVFDNALATAARMGAAPLFSEFGDTQDLATIRRYTRLADSRMTGWMYWGYKDWVDVPGGAGSGALFDDSEDLGTLRESKADAVSQTYPMAIAGEPSSFGFDPATAEFLLEYSPDPAVGSSPTVIFVPVDRHYPGGYTISVSGATKTSAPCSPYLTLQNEPSATLVKVTVTAGGGCAQ